MVQMMSSTQVLHTHDAQPYFFYQIQKENDVSNVWEHTPLKMCIEDLHNAAISLLYFADINLSVMKKYIRKSGSSGNRTRTTGSVARNPDYQTTEAHATEN
jgi:hypothetical protein